MEEDIVTASENRIEILKRRTRRCKCKYCGGKLELRRIIFHDIEEVRVEIFCNSCDRIEFGVEPEIYRSAENFVDNLGFNFFPELDQNEQTRDMNIAKVSEIMSWCCKNIGILQDEGFQVPLNMQDHEMAGLLILDSDQIDPEESGMEKTL